MVRVSMPTTAFAPTAVASSADALEGQMAGAVEDVGEFLDLAAGHGFERAEDAAGGADGIGDVAEDELDGREAGVELAVEFLPVGAGGEHGIAAGVLAAL